MKSHKFCLIGIAGSLLSLLYLGLLCQSGKILYIIISADLADDFLPASSFISPTALILGILCLISSLIFCAIDLLAAYRKSK